jgi:hypothetical protein
MTENLHEFRRLLDEEVIYCKTIFENTEDESAKEFWKGAYVMTKEIRGLFERHLKKPDRPVSYGTSGRK